MAQTRLRKTFAYPDSDADSVPSDLDEQEQETLISSLIAADAEKTQNYKKAFLALPLLATILYIPYLPSPTPFLAITSLLSSAYTLWQLPTQADDQAAAVLFPKGSGPLRRYLDHLNAGACLILLLAAVRAKRLDGVAGEEIWLNILPTLVFLLLYFVRTQLRPVDVRELEKLRYGYKGA